MNKKKLFNQTHEEIPFEEIEKEAMEHQKPSVLSRAWKGLVKTATPLILAAVMITSAFVFAACGDKSIDSTQPGTHQSTGKPTEENPVEEKPGDDKPGETDEEKEQERQLQDAATKISAFVKSLEGGNFTVLSNNSTKVELDGNKMRFSENGVEKYIFEYNAEAENGGYIYTLNDQNQWQKDFAEEGARYVEAFLQAVGENQKIFDGITWTSVGNGVVTGNKVGDSRGCHLAFGNDGSVALSAEGYTYKVWDVDSTSIALPEPVIDNTIPVPETDNIYEKVNGEYVFNIPLLKDVLEDFMKGKNSEKEDFLKYYYFMGSDSYKMGNIEYISVTESSLRFGFTYYKGTDQYFSTTSIEDSALFKKIQGGGIKTKDEFIDHFSNMEMTEVGAVSKGLRLDNTISKERKFEMAQKVLDKLVNTGVQSRSIVKTDSSTVRPDFEGATVSNVLVSTRDSFTGGLGLGRNDETVLIITITKKNGEVSVITADIHVPTSAYLNDYDENLNGGYFVVKNVDETRVNNGNELLYDVQGNKNEDVIEK